MTVSVPVAAAFGVYGYVSMLTREYWDVGSDIVAVPAVFGMLTLILAALLYLVRSRSLAVMLLSVDTMLLAPAFGWQIAAAFHRGDVRRAMAVCEALEPALEELRKADGRYPDTLGPLAPADPPILLRYRPYYDSSGSSFTFEVGAFYYSSETREWTEMDFLSGCLRWFACP